MASDGQKVSLEAEFKSSGLDRLGRQFDLVSEKMRRMGSSMRALGQGNQQDFSKQFATGGEMQRGQEKILGLRRDYIKKLREIEDTTDEGRKKSLREELAIIAQRGAAELREQDRLGRGAADTSSKLMTAANLRRGMRIGLGALGLPLSLGAAGRQMGEAMEQEKMVGGMALRLRETVGPIKDFTEHTMELRRNIVAAGAEFAFSGRESLALADNLSQMAGGLVDMKTVFEGARGLGVAPQATGQALALSRRLGGVQSPANDEKLMHTIAKGISEGGMMPRSSEFIQTVVQAMQTYSTRLPSVSPDTFVQMFSALSAEGTAGKPGVGRLAPTLRGQGGAQVTQGLTSMMDDMSEAMVAIQSEIVSNDPKAFAKTAKQLGLPVGGPISGGDRYAMVTALKQAGVADPDGLRLAGRTIKEVTMGLDKGTRIAVESQLLRLSPQIIAALEQGGFINRLTNETIGFNDFKKTVDRLSGNAETAMSTPSMQASRLARDIGAATTNWFEDKMPSNVFGASSEMFEEAFLPGSRATAAQKESSLKNLRGVGNITAAGVVGTGLAMASGVGIIPALATGLLATGVGFGARELLSPESRSGSGSDQRPLDIKITVSGENLRGNLAQAIAERLSAEISKHTGRSSGTTTIQGSPNPNSDKGGR